MVRKTRASVWYGSWMDVGDRGGGVDILEKRMEVAEQLLDTITKPRFDAQTFDELTQVLDHECLCLRAAGHNGGQHTATVAALRNSWTSSLVTKLSQCLFQTIYAESHYERELQARALFSALALQRARETSTFAPGHHQAICKRLKDGYRELQWQKKWSGPFSREKFRKFQCSFLLCACAEYMKGFDVARPVVADVLSRTIGLILAGGSLAMAITTGWGPGSLQSLIEALDRAFRPLCESPDRRFEALFGLQELTRVTLALYLYQDVVGSSTTEPGDLARWILERILSIVKDDPFEKAVSPMWEYLSALANIGPPSIDRYFYLYGLLDCATQLGKVVDSDRVPQPLILRMEEIIENSTEDSFRWKALEFLLSDSKVRRVRVINIINDFERKIPNLGHEIMVIKECLAEEEEMISSSRRSSQSFHEQPITVRCPPVVTLDPNEWIEDDTARMDLSMPAKKFKLSIERGGLNIFGSRQINYFSSGLSPDCRFSFFLSDNVLDIHPVDALNTGTPRIFRQMPQSPKGYKFAKVTISNNLLAVITKQEGLNVYEYGSNIKDGGRKVGAQVVEQWDPKCLAIHEANDCTWICAGGRLDQAIGSIGSGNITMYRIDGGHGRLTLSQHSAHFDRPSPDPLSGDFPKMVNFSHDGGRLVCLTNRNCVLVWFLSNNARPRQAPFQITKEYRKAINARGIECAVLFNYADSRNPYVLCTTSPSPERARYGGEWPFVSPVASSPAKVPPGLEHPFENLGKSKAIHVGAVSPDGRVAALWDATKSLILVPLSPSSRGGLHTRTPIILEEKLESRPSMSPTSLRFRVESDKCLYLYAIDVKGKVVTKQIKHVRN
ncbi:MAG: hypothetical protein M1813_005340 [Trichoglossum hirsutum]|nr:MAG: hypothetical protein M1813_005340 [Trichoglossum hirsutum]